MAPRSGRRFAVLLAIPSVVLVVLALQHVSSPVAGVRPAVPDPAVPETPPSEPAACAGLPPPPERADFEQRVIELVNERRQKAGRPPLKRTDALASSARWFAHDMAASGYFAEDHATYRRSGRRLVPVCDWSARLGSFYRGWTALAENIAAGYATPEELVAGWLDSPSHRVKILSGSHWETGAGYWAGGPEGHYWVQDFGRRDGVFPVVIAGEKASTRGARVSVHLYGSWQEMRLRNDEGGSSAWRSFESDFEWSLGAKPGLRTLTVELRDERRTARSSDTIRVE